MTTQLAPYAVTQAVSRGRKFTEKPHPYRDHFERDRDRIIHCSAFRRLEGKTQVFTPGLDDYYRTRLTHTIEVAQIARTIAARLRLNETLTEAVCLAHDLGHPPFGHTGETILNELMASFGGFEHNTQTLRIIDLLEHPYPDFPGLNLTYETRLALAKHKTTYDSPATDEFPEKNCTLEGQIASLADRIAYNCHDLEDALRADILTENQLAGLELFSQAQKAINAARIADTTVRRTRTAKAIIDRLVSSALAESKNKIQNANINSPEDVYELAENLITLDSANESRLTRLEDFLLENFYRHKAILQNTPNIKHWLTDLFGRFCRDPELMPGYFRSFIPRHGLERTVCGYIAGMTDRYCMEMAKRK